MTAREVQWLLIGEALLLGAVGSALGLALGAALATVSLQLLGGDLGSGFFSGTQPERRIFDQLRSPLFSHWDWLHQSREAGCLRAMPLAPHLRSR